MQAKIISRQDGNINFTVEGDTIEEIAIKALSELGYGIVKPQTIKVFNIKYDTDGRKVKLPKELVFTVDDLEFDPKEDLADMISDETGYCIFGCEYEIM